MLLNTCYETAVVSLEHFHTGFETAVPGVIIFFLPISKGKKD